MTDDPIRGEVTRILGEVCAGDTEAAKRFVAVVYGELHRIASSKMRGERDDHTLQPTALVHEAYMRLMGGGEVRFENRAHFFGAAAEAMRRILVDHARRRQAEKRGGGRVRVTMTASLDAARDDAELVTGVDGALEALAETDPKAARVVELRFFGGLSVDQTAEVMGVSPRTVKRLWSFARAWLFRALGAD